jgi:hypothetical protein
MKLGFCAVCGTTEGLHQHHIQPIVLTGIKRTRKRGYNSNKPLKDCDSKEIFAFLFDQGVISDDETITVCDYHHNILHGIMKFQMADHSSLIKNGIEKARQNGTVLGRPTVVNEDLKNQLVTLRASGVPIKKIAKQLDIGIGTFYKIMEEKSQ